MEKEYENICISCSKSFITSDVEAIYCDECWAKMMAEALDTDVKEELED